jgi:tRNA (adenine57-N1/adenine58-N1)-methyltransferase
MTKPFAEGERVLLIDRKKRRYLVTLAIGGEFHSHAGFVAHEKLIGASEGTSVSSTMNATYVAVRPTLAEFVTEMPRGAQVIYPKDIGPMLLLGDIGPGVDVLESGVGSGALSMGMLRCGANICGYELREDFAAKARKNVASFLGAGALDRYDVHIRDCYDGIDGVFDRIVLDLPEPWQVIPHAAAGALHPGGIFVSYSPSIVQAARTKHALDDHGFLGANTIEVLQRGWYIEGQAVRPNHRMVAHTGFLTSARLLAPVTPKTAEPKTAESAPQGALEELA